MPSFVVRTVVQVQTRSLDNDPFGEDIERLPRDYGRARILLNDRVCGGP
jgi:hypothetical protein